MSCWKPLLLALTLFANNAAGTEARPNAQDPEIEQRLLGLAADLRCVVCQNESLAESRAPLAQDLRQEVRDLMKQGNTDQQVVEFLTLRYGDFVLYRPPFKPVTYLLWGGPVLFLAIGGLAWLIIIRRRHSLQGADDLSEEDVRTAAEILRSERP